MLLSLLLHEGTALLCTIVLAQHLKILLLPLLLVLRGRKSFVGITRHPTIAIFSTGPPTIWNLIHSSLAFNFYIPYTPTTKDILETRLEYSP